MGRDTQPSGGGRVDSVAPEKRRPLGVTTTAVWWRAQEPEPPPQAMKFEPPLGSRPPGIPRHIRDQEESKVRFHLLPIVAIEPYPEGEMEWDNDGATPSPLRPVESWPRLRGRRHRFNPREVEGQGETQPPFPASEPPMGRLDPHADIPGRPPSEHQSRRRRANQWHLGEQPTSPSPETGGRRCLVDWGEHRARRHDDLPTVSLTSANAPNGACSSGVSDQFRGTD